MTRKEMTRGKSEKREGSEAANKPVLEYFASCERIIDTWNQTVARPGDKLVLITETLAEEKNRKRTVMRIHAYLNGDTKGYRLMVFEIKKKAGRVVGIPLFRNGGFEPVDIAQFQKMTEDFNPYRHRGV